MARLFARKFYNSKEWLSCRDAYKLSVDGLCERCLAKDIYEPGIEVHHQTYLSPDNINDPFITLNWDNLELLCQSCHSIEHMSKYEATREDVVFDSEGNLILRN